MKNIYLFLGFFLSVGAIGQALYAGNESFSLSKSILRFVPKRTVWSLFENKSLKTVVKLKTIAQTFSLPSSIKKKSYYPSANYQLVENLKLPVYASNVKNNVKNNMQKLVNTYVNKRLSMHKGEIKQSHQYVTEQQVKSSLNGFEKTVETNYALGQVAQKTPTWLLSNINKKRLSFSPAVNHFYNNREESVQELVQPKTVNFMNDLMRDYHTTMPQSAKTEHDQEMHFFNIVEKKGVHKSSYAEQNAAGFVYYRIFYADAKK